MAPANAPRPAHPTHLPILIRRISCLAAKRRASSNPASRYTLWYRAINLRYNPITHPANEIITG